jgi:SpoVK/Ycf46/Vps4 family AAA+-type ATPase
MATTEQIKALIQSHLERDEDRFYAVAMQLAAHAARQGHGKVAEEIKTLVDEAKLRSRAIKGQAVPIAAPRGELAGLLAVSYPKTRVADMVLDRELVTRLQRILREQRAQQRLLGRGLQPRRKLLLVGAPGTGKTMTAAALAGELHLPLYVILLEGLITKFMGETAAKLRLVFDALGERRGVYLFDEFDAIGDERATRNDVGEIRRVLNSFLTFLEQDQSQSLIVAATNHPQALDGALFRRFDDVIEFALPSPEGVEPLIRNKLAVFDIRRLGWSEVRKASEGLSHADITRACEAAQKDAVLSDTEEITTAALVAALEERRRNPRG